MREIIDHIKLRPKYCVWELTLACNMRCRHCASNAGEASRGEELSLDEALALGRQLAELGCEDVTLSGGEALLRPDWEEIAQYLTALGLKVSLITNGLLIDRSMARRIAAAGITRVALSLDGLRETHNYIRRHPHSFDRLRQALPAIAEQGVPLNIVTHINRLNFPELPALEELIVSWPVNVWRLQLGSPMGRMAANPELVVAPEDLPAIADFVVGVKLRGRVLISVGDNIGYFSHHESVLRRKAVRKGWDFWCGCSAGCLNVGIESNGNVKGCLSLQSSRFVEGNIRQEPLRAIWEKPGNFAYTRGFTPADLHGYCLNCEFGEICRGGCVFMSYGATGSPHNNPYCLYHVLNSSSAEQGQM